MQCDYRAPRRQRCTDSTWRRALGSSCAATCGVASSKPKAPGREADALRFGALHGLQVPELIAADVTGDEVGDGVPVLLMAYLQGQPIAVPDLHQLAESAASIHAVNADDLGHDYFPWYEAEMTTPPPLSRQPELWEEAVHLWRDAMPEYRSTFIHRDFRARVFTRPIVNWATHPKCLLARCRGRLRCRSRRCRRDQRRARPGAPRGVADRWLEALLRTGGGRSSLNGIRPAGS